MAGAFSALPQGRQRNWTYYVTTICHGVTSKRAVQTSEEYADAKIEALRRKARGPHAPAAGTPTFRELGEEWLAVKEAGSRRVKAIDHTTLAKYRGVFRNHLSPLFEAPVTELQPETIDDLYDAMLGRGLSADVVRSAHTLVAGIRAYAIQLLCGSFVCYSLSACR